VLESTEGGSSIIRRWGEKREQGDDDGPDEVDVVVVENQFLTEGTRGSITHTQPSEHDTPEKSGVASGSQMHTDYDSFHHSGESFFFLRNHIMAFFRWRVFPIFSRLTDLSFEDPAAERHYIKETWYTGKSLALYASLYFVLNWVLACVNLARPYQKADYVFYFAVRTLWPWRLLPSPTRQHA
jgi:osomolarity two-component system, sensor histidine kinase SLN1